MKKMVVDGGCQDSDHQTRLKDWRGVYFVSFGELVFSYYWLYCVILEDVVFGPASS